MATGGNKQQDTDEVYESKRLQVTQLQYAFAVQLLKCTLLQFLYAGQVVYSVYVSRSNPNFKQEGLPLYDSVFSWHVPCLTCLLVHAVHNHHDDGAGAEVAPGAYGPFVTRAEGLS